MATDSKDVPTQLVDMMTKLAGAHPGFRPAHAKGIVGHGTFRATADAKRMTKAEPFQGQPVPVTIRIANASGNPEIGDGAPGVRSLSIKMPLANGKPTDILANSVEGFPARTPEDFLAFLTAQAPDPATGKPSPDAVPKFLGAHPETRAFIERVGKKAVPASYAQVMYHAEHAFRFTAADGSTRFGRWHWIPEAGEAFIAPDAGAQRDRDFLRTELAERLTRGPVRFRLVLQVAEAGDPTNDATALWPETRTRVEMGTLEISSLSPTSAADERALIFDPTNLPDGIAVSDDPILAARSRAYGVSYERRQK